METLNWTCCSSAPLRTKTNVNVLYADDKSINSISLAPEYLASRIQEECDNRVKFWKCEVGNDIWNLSLCSTNWSACNILHRCAVRRTNEWMSIWHRYTSWPILFFFVFKSSVICYSCGSLNFLCNYSGRANYSGLTLHCSFVLKSTDTSPLIQVLNYSLQPVGGWDCSDCSRWKGKRGSECVWRWHKGVVVRVNTLTKYASMSSSIICSHKMFVELL